MTTPVKNLAKPVAIFRIAFGSVWLIDAVLKWQPAFLNHLNDFVMDSAVGQPVWIKWWFDAFMPVIMNYSHPLAIGVAVIESLIAVLLIVGAFKKRLYVLGAIFALLIWSFGEGFGGPYAAGSTDIGASIIYVFVFAALYLLDLAVPQTWAVDRWLIPLVTKRTPIKK